MLLSLWYSDSTLNAILLNSKTKRKQKEKKISHTGWENRQTKNERNMEMRIITCFGYRTRSGTFSIIVSDSRTKITRSHGPMIINVFNSVTSPRVLSYRCELHYFVTMPVDFNFSLTFGLKPQVGGIKFVTVYKRSIFQVEWLIAT